MLEIRTLVGLVRGGALALAVPVALCPRTAFGAVSTEITAGSGHTCARNAGGQLYCWGKNASGQLGTADLTPRAVPALVGLGAVLEVAARVDHTCARTTAGAAFCWGDNSHYAVGDGTNTNRSQPTAVTGLGSGVAQIVAGAYHACARKADQTLWCWGWNAIGQLGDGTTTDRPTPVQVTALGNAVAEVTAGDYHTCARKTDGTLWCWGYNIIGQLGVGTTDDHVSPTQVAQLENTVREISAGDQHTCARINDGSVYCWGANEYGQIGKNDTVSRQNPVQVLTAVARVQAGGYHTCALKTDQSYWCWGRRDHGQLGDGVLGAPRLTPLSVSLPALAPVFEIAGGDLHGCTHHGDGTLWCEGKGTEGQIGDNASVDRATPVKVMDGLSVLGAARAPATSRPLLALLGSLLAGVALLHLRGQRRRISRADGS